MAQRLSNRLSVGTLLDARNPENALFGPDYILSGKSKKKVNVWQEIRLNRRCEMIRSFVAIDLPERTQAALQAVIERLQAETPRGSVRWSRVSGIHLTLQFLGDVAEGKLDKIITALTEVAVRHRPFTVSVQGTGCFPNMRGPRVVWAGVAEESGALAALQRDVEQALIPLGFKPEDRAYHPHLTLGRAGRSADASDQRRLGEVVATTDVGELDRVKVAAFKLMRSDLRPDGAVYTPLAEFPLGRE
jgi:RNA 2',3'-cyclic 3'-phosphodiesterase